MLDIEAKQIISAMGFIFEHLIHHFLVFVEVQSDAIMLLEARNDQICFSLKFHEILFILAGLFDQFLV